MARHQPRIQNESKEEFKFVRIEFQLRMKKISDKYDLKIKQSGMSSTLEPKCIPQMSYRSSQTNPHITALKRLRNVKVPDLLFYNITFHGATLRLTG